MRKSAGPFDLTVVTAMILAEAPRQTGGFATQV